MDYDYDLFVVGAGSGGLAASKRAAAYGAKVAIAEADLVGGTCVIRGCVPKKLMVYASQFSGYYKYAEGYGWSEVQPQFDWKTLVDAVDREVRRLSARHISFLEKAGVELVQGLARFVDSHTLEVGDRKVTARHVLIAVGGEAVKPPLPGIEHTITSREMFLLPEQPKRFVVLGGGYIGVEFAGILHGLGSQVTQIIRGDRLLRGFDEDIRENIQTGMVARGIDVRTGVNTASLAIEKTDDGLKLTYDLPDGGTETLMADAILSATGRRPKPQLEPLNLANTSVEVVDGAIAVTQDSATTESHIYAVGDCTDRINLTPVAIAEGRAFADTVFGHKPRAISHQGVPSAVFSQPEGATVGWTEAEARDRYGDAVKVYRARFRPMFHSFTGSEEKVMVKLVVLGEEERVLGVHMTGKDAAEIIQGMAVAYNMGATKADFDRTIGIHPSTAEEFVTLR